MNDYRIYAKSNLSLWIRLDGTRLLNPLQKKKYIDIAIGYRKVVMDYIYS